jgi:hypothetical protein
MLICIIRSKIYKEVHVRAMVKGCYIHFERQVMPEDVAIPPRELPFHEDLRCLELPCHLWSVR